MNKEMDRQENQLSRGKFIKLLGVIGAAPIISACERVINPLPTRSGPEATPEVGFTPTSTPTETPESSPTPESTSEPTPTETVEPVNTLTHTEFQSRSDEELKTIAPKPKTQELGFAQGTELVPDTIVRGGEGANYILYKNPQTNNIELAWNAETGTQEHAIYSTYEKEINGEICTGIPCLFLTDSTVLQESGGGGWFGLNPDFPDAQDRVGRAFNTALGIFYWCKVVRPNDYSFGVSYDHKKNLPDFSDITGYADLTQELEEIWTNQFYYNEVSGPLREKVGNYISDKFLITLKEKRELGETMSLRLKAVRSESIDLTQQKLFIVRVINSGKYQYSDMGDIFEDQYFAFHTPTLKFITQLSANPVTLEIDSYRYDKHSYVYGGHLAGFLRYFFGDYLYSAINYPFTGSTSYQKEDRALFFRDFTTAVGAIIYPPELQSPEIQQLYKVGTLPVLTMNYGMTRPYPGQQTSFKFYKMP